MSSNQWIADRRLYLDKDGKAVEANDPTRKTLLVSAGGSLLLADAIRLGLSAAPAPVDPIKRRPANKIKEPTANKRG